MRLRLLTASLSRLLWLLALLALALYLYIYGSYAGALLSFPFDYDQGEGYDVYSGILLAQGHGIYNDNDVYPFYSSNYPPLYSALVALAVQLFGPSLFAGRLVSIVASALLGLLIYAIVWRNTRSRLNGAVAAGAFFASTYAYHVAPLARVNASMALLALLGVSCAGRLRWRWLAPATLFLLAALYTKQTAVDAAAAGVLFLLLNRWRQAVVMAAALVVLGGVTFYLLEQASGGHFYLNVVEANVNPYDWQQTAEYYGNFFGIHAILLGLAALGLLLSLWRRSPTIYHLYLLTSLATAGAAGKWGAGESYFLNAVVALCICAGLALGQLDRRAPFWLRPALPLLFLMQMPLFWHGPIDGQALGLEDRGLQSRTLGHPPTSLDAANGWRIMTHVARARGALLLEESAFALVDHRPIVGNPSQLLNLSRLGRWDDRELVRALDQKRFGLVMLKAQFYPGSVLRAIDRNYGTAAVLEMAGRPYRILTPKPQEALMGDGPPPIDGQTGAGPEPTAPADTGYETPPVEPPEPTETTEPSTPPTEPSL